jgi:hypothetical protein
MPGGLLTPYLGLAKPLPRPNRSLAGADLRSSAMNRRHGLFLAVAIGLAAVAGTYAAFQTTDLGAQANTLSQKEFAAAELRLDKQEAALRRAARKRPPRLPELPARASAGAGASRTASVPAAQSGAPGSSRAGSPSSGGWDEGSGHDFDDDGSGHGGDDDHSGHGRGDDFDDDRSGHGGDDDFDDRSRHGRDDFDDDRSGHGGGDDFDDDHSGHGGGGGDD